MRITYFKQITMNSSGGVQLAMHLQQYAFLGDPEPAIKLFDVQIGPDQDWDERIKLNNDAIEALGFPPMDTKNVEQCKKLRDIWVALPMVQEEFNAWKADEAVRKSNWEKLEEQRLDASTKMQTDFQNAVADAVDRVLADRLK